MMLAEGVCFTFVCSCLEDIVQKVQSVNVGISSVTNAYTRDRCFCGGVVWGFFWGGRGGAGRIGWGFFWFVVVVVAHS